MYQVTGSSRSITRSEGFAVPFIMKLSRIFLTFSSIVRICTHTKDILLDRIEYEFLFNCSNLVVNICFLISNRHKYHMRFKSDRAV